MERETLVTGPGWCAVKLAVESHQWGECVCAHVQQSLLIQRIVVRDASPGVSVDIIYNDAHHDTVHQAFQRCNYKLTNRQKTISNTRPPNAWDHYYIRSLLSVEWRTFSCSGYYLKGTITPHKRLWLGSSTKSPFAFATSMPVIRLGYSETKGSQDMRKLLEATCLYSQARWLKTAIDWAAYTGSWTGQCTRILRALNAQGKAISTETALYLCMILSRLARCTCWKQLITLFDYLRQRILMCRSMAVVYVLIDATQTSRRERIAARLLIGL